MWLVMLTLTVWAWVLAHLFLFAVLGLFGYSKVLRYLLLTLPAGVLLFVLSTIGASAGVMFLATLGVLLAYMPTIALSNSAAVVTVATSALSNVRP